MVGPAFAGRLKSQVSSPTSSRGGAELCCLVVDGVEGLALEDVGQLDSAVGGSKCRDDVLGFEDGIAVGDDHPGLSADRHEGGRLGPFDVADPLAADR